MNNKADSELEKIINDYGHGVDSQGYDEGKDEAIAKLQALINSRCEQRAIEARIDELEWLGSLRHEQEYIEFKTIKASLDELRKNEA